jgi:hypothetical protein
MEQSYSSEANSRLASQEIPRLSWNPKVHYRVRRSPPLAHMLNHCGKILFMNIYLKIQAYNKHSVF